MAEKIVLLLNDINNHEGLLSALTTSGRKYKRKELHSSVNNWLSIIGIFQTNNVVAVVGKMNGRTYGHLVNPEFDDVRRELFKRIAAVPNRIFIYEELLKGTGNLFGQYSSGYRENLEDLFEMHDVAKYGGKGHEIANALLIKGNKVLNESGLDIFPYKKRAEITISAQLFVEEIEEGLLFRLYIPSGQLWENEIGRLLALFKDYLAKVAAISVRLDQTSTAKGVIYAFHSQSKGTGRSDLTEHFEDFSKIANLCVVDPEAAEELLNEKNANLREVTQIVSRYGKEMRRLQVDFKHTREQKILSIRQRLESELLDSNIALDATALEKLIDSVAPRIVGTFTPNQLLLSSPVESNLTINLNQQFINKVTGIVGQEVSGMVALSSEDKKLFELFKRFGSDKESELVSALHELNDDSAPEAGRVTAKQKLKRFLIACADKGTDLGVGLLQTYIEKKILGLS